MKLRSFQGLVPSSDKVEEVAAVPYDVCNRAEAKELADGKPYSLLHVDRAEIDLPDEVDAYDDSVYQQALLNFQKLQNDGYLVREAKPVLYLYTQVMNGHRQTGIVGVCHIDDYQNDIIRKHEKTRQVKEDDRSKLVDTLNANTGPIFLTYREQEQIDNLVTTITERDKPVYDFVAPDGIQHILWKVEPEEAQQFETHFDTVPLSYVADGHHRSASAHRVGTERRNNNSNHTGEEDYNWFLSVLFPGEQLKILPYNRKSLGEHSAQETLDKISTVFELLECSNASPQETGTCAVYCDGKWYEMTLKKPAQADPVSSLDVSILQDSILAPLLNVDDPRTSDNIDFVGGIRGTEELEKLVDSGSHGIAFSMYPVTVDELMDIADAGQIMPPKSTWFEPKLRSGLFIHTF